MSVAMSVESSSSIKLQSETGWEYACLSQKTSYFQYEICSAFRGVDKVAHLKLYFSFVKTHFRSPYHSLVEGK